MSEKSVREHADLMIEQAKKRLDDRENPPTEYEAGYEQGKKDALRVILLCLDDPDPDARRWCCGTWKSKPHADACDEACSCLVEESEEGRDEKHERGRPEDEQKRE